MVCYYFYAKKHHLISTNLQGTCKLCSGGVANCLQCSSSGSICIKCKPNFYLYADNGTEYTQCVACDQNNHIKSGDATGTGICTNCSQSISLCNECQNDATDCKVCQAGAYLWDGNKDGKYEKCTECLQNTFYYESGAIRAFPYEV